MCMLVPHSSTMTARCMVRLNHNCSPFSSAWQLKGLIWQCPARDLLKGNRSSENFVCVPKQVCEVTSLRRLVLSTEQGGWDSEHARRRSADLQVLLVLSRLFPACSCDRCSQGTRSMCQGSLNYPLCIRRISDACCWSW